MKLRTHHASLALPLFGILLAAACAPKVVQPATSTLTRETKTQCSNHCSTLDMGLGAVVVMANHAGCVCVPTNDLSVAVGGVASAGGLLVVQQAVAAEQEQAEADKAEAEKKKEEERKEDE